MVRRSSDAGCVSHQNPLLTSNSLSSMPKALPFVRVERFVDRLYLNHSEAIWFPHSGRPPTTRLWTWALSYRRSGCFCPVVTMMKTADPRLGLDMAR